MISKEKAIEGLKGLKEIFVPVLIENNYEGLGKSDSKEFAETMDLAVEALEKQIPKKPIYHGKCFATNYTCPVCGRLYWGKEYIGNHCDSCGQKLDWEVDNSG